MSRYSNNKRSNPNKVLADPCGSADQHNDPHVTLCSQDVIVGQGRGAYESEGNIRYMELVRSNVDTYKAATNNAEKIQCTKDIYNEIARRGGRFLGVDKISKTLYEVPEKQARIKIGQALRHRKREQKSQTNNNNNNTVMTPTMITSPFTTTSLPPPSLICTERPSCGVRRVSLNEEDKKALAVLDVQSFQEEETCSSSSYIMEKKSRTGFVVDYSSSYSPRRVSLTEEDKKALAILEDIYDISLPAAAPANTEITLPPKHSTTSIVSFEEETYDTNALSSDLLLETSSIQSFDDNDDDYEPKQIIIMDNCPTTSSSYDATFVNPLFVPTAQELIHTTCFD